MTGELKRKSGMNPLHPPHDPHALKPIPGVGHTLFPPPTAEDEDDDKDKDDAGRLPTCCCPPDGPPNNSSAMAWSALSTANRSRNALSSGVSRAINSASSSAVRRNAARSASFAAFARRTSSAFLRRSASAAICSGVLPALGSSGCGGVGERTGVKGGDGINYLSPAYPFGIKRAPRPTHIDTEDS